MQLTAIVPHNLGEEGIATIPFERQEKILNLLKSRGLLYTKEIADSIPGASESTIRRDLKSLASEGRIELIRGGARYAEDAQDTGAVDVLSDAADNADKPHKSGLEAQKPAPGQEREQTEEVSDLRDEGTEDSPVLQRYAKNISEKDRIARFAASLVEDGDTVYLDAGSTAACMVKYLKGRHVTIVTTNMLVASELAKAGIRDGEMTCMIVGGTLLMSTGSIVGSETNNTLRGLYFKKAFLGISGISAAAGFNTFDNRESEKKQIVRKNSESTYILADNTKFNISTLCKTFELGEVTVITEKETDLIKSTGNYLIAE